MSNSDDKETGKMSQIEEKIDNLTNIFQKFGLDFITKIGQQSTRLNMVDDKIEELNKVTLDIKGLLPKLNNIIESQKKLENEVDLLKTLVQNRRFVDTPENGDPEASENDTPQTAEPLLGSVKPFLEKFDMLKKQLVELNDPKKLAETLEQLKEQLYEVSGGNRILYEISRSIKDLKSASSLNNGLKGSLKEKIDSWIMKL